jgi:hypothetical protein
MQAKGADQQRHRSSETYCCAEFRAIRQKVPTIQDYQLDIPVTPIDHTCGLLVTAYITTTRLHTPAFSSIFTAGSPA